MRLIAENLGGERGGQPVFSGVDFSLGDGDSLIVTGPNGAGKSTLLRVVAGLLPEASGSVRLEGGGEAFPTVAAASHYLGHLNAMKPALTVAENLRFWRDFCGEPPISRWRKRWNGRPRHDRPSALRLSVDRPAPPGGDRQAAGQPPPCLAARRADGRARHCVRGAVFRADGGASRQRAASSSPRRICRSGWRVRGAGDGRALPSLREGRSAKRSGVGVVQNRALHLHPHPAHSVRHPPRKGEGKNARPLPPRHKTRHPRRRRSADRRAVLPRGHRHHPLRRRAGPQPSVAHRPGDPVDRRAARFAARPRPAVPGRPRGRLARSPDPRPRPPYAGVDGAGEMPRPLDGERAAAGRRSAAVRPVPQHGAAGHRRRDAHAARRHAGHHLRRARRARRSRSACRAAGCWCRCWCCR